MNSRLRQFDEHLWQNLEDKGIAPEYYTFRWLTVLFTQEFEMPDVWRIWDSVLADTGGVERDYDFLLDFGCAMNYPPIDIQPILYLATVIRELRVKGSKKQTATVNEYKDRIMPRPSIDLRIWNTASLANEHHSVSSTFERRGPQDMMASTIDGVQNSDRLDHNLNGTDHSSPPYTTRSTTLKKDRQSNMSGLNLNGLWLNANNSGSSTSEMLNVKQPSSCGLSVDNCTMKNGSRPQTATWSETFAQLKLRFVGSESPPDNKFEGTKSAKTQVAIPSEPIGAISPSVEL
ncbi:hypothetical protein BGX27_010828 [Mortierella sp. AM989]|nr:hypothetical protein BGX27_010828 [Mortierella sp. AM989]